MSLYAKFSKLTAKINAWRATERDCFKICTTFLGYMGLWSSPYEKTSINSKFWYLVARINLVLNLYVMLIGHPVLIYFCWKSGDIYQITESIVFIFIGALVFLELYFLLYQRTKLNSLLHTMEQMKEAGRLLPFRPLDIFERNNALVHWVFVYFYCFLFILLTTYTMLPQLHYKRDLIYRVWFPFDRTRSPAYEIVFALQAFVHGYALSMMLCFAVIVMALLTEAIGQLRYLSYNLLNIRSLPERKMEKNNDNDTAEEENSDAVDKKLLLDLKQTEQEEFFARNFILCVLHHCTIIRFLKELQADYYLYLSLVFVCNLVGTGVGVILIVFGQDFGEKMLFRVGLLLSTYIFMYIFCWLSDKISEEDEGLRDAVFGCDWLRASDSFKRSMRIIMSRSNQPMVIRVAGFIPMNMETFYKTMKLTYTYTMAMINQFQLRA